MQKAMRWTWLIHHCRFDVRWALIVAVAVSFPPNAAAGETGASGWPDGTIEPTCAPYDGPAFVILSKQVDGTFVRLTGMDSIENANGTWNVVLGAHRGQGQASICDPQKPSSSSCAYGRSGSFTVRPTGANEWRVEFSASFMQAGKTNDVHGAFNVIRPKQTDDRPRFCG